MAEHAEVPWVQTAPGQAGREAPVRVGAQLHEQEAGAAAESGIGRHAAMVPRVMNCYCYKQFCSRPTWRGATVSTVSVRYIADDVDAAVAFYVERLGFDVEMRPAPGFAMLARGDLRLLLNQPGAGGAGQPAGGRSPEPGGWNRIQLEVADLEHEVEALRAAGASFRGEVVTGRGGSQILVEDPSGNPVELFQPAG
jgi:catechol 2,3-dioxygenase-like lactoylglutathione lyase family enzyme